MVTDRLAEIGKRAAKLCYANNHQCQDNICVGSCAAVIPFQFLEAAGRELFDEYWEEHKKNYDKTSIS